MFNIALCDDNVQFLNLLKEKIRQECARLMPDSEECLLGPTFSTGHEVLTYLRERSVDILFLDIDMPVLSGFQLANILCTEYPRLLIVFMSAFDNFVYDAFDYQPFAYMRKDRMAYELPMILRRIVDKLTEPTRRIILSTTDGDKKVDVKSVLYFESARNYVITHMVHGKSYTCRGTLADIEKQLDSFDFYRIHSAFLVNLEYVERIAENGFVFLKSVALPIAQRRLTEFRKIYLNYTRRYY